MLSQIGPTELLVILAIVLLIIGPKKLPELARSIGLGVKEFRRGVKDNGQDDNEPPKSRTSEQA